MLKQDQVYTQNSHSYLEERIRLQGSISAPHIRLETANEFTFFWETENKTYFPLPDTRPQSFWNADWEIDKTGNTHSRGRVDRLFLQLKSSDLELVIGKQVIAMGVGQLFNAVSQVQTYPLVVIDPEFQKTEDAVSLIYSSDLQLEARFLPKVAGQTEHNMHLRAKKGIGATDVATGVGRSDDKIFCSFDFATNLGDSVLRGEVIGYRTKQETTFLQSLLGWDTVLNSKLSATLEGFFNGVGGSGNYYLTTLGHRSTPYRGRWYFGFSLKWEPHPLLKLNMGSVTNVSDPSLLLHLVSDYSLGNSLDLLLGMYLGVGSDSSEFGGKMNTPIPSAKVGLPSVFYTAFRFYF